MNWLDWILLVMLGFSVVSGLMRGLIKTVFGMAGLVVGILLAGRYYTVLAPRLSFIPQENLAKIAAFIIIAAVVILVANILGITFKKVVSLLLLGSVDRIGGAILGLALGIISLGTGLALVAKYPFLNLDQVVSNSRLAPLLMKSFPLLQSWFPSDFSSLRDFFR